jgi:UV DNA damage endonuclease
MIEKLGYCCINTELRQQDIFCSRSLIKRTFTLELASERALQNCRDLLTILKWNLEHDIFVFRISSELFPRYTCKTHGYSFTDLKDHVEISDVLSECGEFAYEHGMSLSFHPGPFTTIASPNPISAQAGIDEVEYHSFLCDLIDPNDVLDIPINFHVGGSYKQTWDETATRFIASFNQLSDNARKRICVENDDKASCWSVKKLYEYIHLPTGIPICFDIHHWLFCHEDDRTMEQDFQLALSTWYNRSMQIHYSESRDPNKLVPAHSDYYTQVIPEFVEHAEHYHIHLECKMKEDALLKYRENALCLV